MGEAALGAGLFLALLASALLLLRSVTQHALSRTRASYRLRFPRELDEAAVLGFLQGMAGVLPPAGRRLLGLPAIVFEVRADSGGISHWLHVPKAWSDYVLGQLRAAIPSVRISEEASEAPNITISRELRLRRGHVPLRTEDMAIVSTSLLACMHPLRDNEAIVLQWVVAPASLDRPSESKLVGEDLADVLTGRQPLPRLTKGERSKLAEPLFLAAGRIGVAAAHGARARDLLARALAAHHAHRSLEARLVSRLLPSRIVSRRQSRATVPLAVFPALLNSRELGALAAFPIESPVLPGLVLGGARELPPLPEVPTQGCELGQATYPGLERTVAVSEADLTRHTLVLGPTGSGKSVLLNNLAVGLMRAGHGVMVVDPAGDLAARLIDSVEPAREQDVIIVDPADVEHPIGLNLLATPNRSKDLVVDDLVAIVKRAWGEHLVQSRSEDLLRVTGTTLCTQHEAVLTDLPRLLMDKRFRRKITATLDDPISLGPFWAWFERLTEPRRAEVIGPISNKARSFYRPILRNMIGQPVSSFSMTEAMQEGKIIICSLARGAMGEDAGNFFGSLLMALWAQAVHARVGVPPDQRRPFYCLVDEFQALLGFSSPIDEILGTARKYGAGVVLATQSLSVLPPELKTASLINTRTKVVFETGAQDAQLLAREFSPHLTADDLRSLDAFHAYAAVSSGFRTAPPASIRTLPPPPTTGSAVRVREFSRERYGRPRAEVEAAIRARYAAEATEAPIGRKAK